MQNLSITGDISQDQPDKIYNLYSMPGWTTTYIQIIAMIWPTGSNNVYRYTRRELGILRKWDEKAEVVVLNESYNKTDQKDYSGVEVFVENDEVKLKVLKSAQYHVSFNIDINYLSSKGVVYN